MHDACMMLRDNIQNKMKICLRSRYELPSHIQHYVECFKHLEDLELLVLCFMQLWKILNFWRFWYLILQILEFLQIPMLAFPLKGETPVKKNLQNLQNL